MFQFQTQISRRGGGNTQNALTDGTLTWTPLPLSDTELVWGEGKRRRGSRNGKRRWKGDPTKFTNRRQRYERQLNCL